MDLLEKLSSYNIFNYLLPGILFAVVADKFLAYPFLQQDIVTGAFVYYFIGLVISRFGSLVVEPILKKIKFLEFAEYKDFVIASKNDPKIEIFSEANNTYRTLCSMSFLLLILWIYKIFQSLHPALNSWSSFVLIGLLLVMFLFSYRKQKMARLCSP